MHVAAVGLQHHNKVVDIRDEFYGACIHNDPVLVDNLLANMGADPNQKDFKGRSILHEVCANGFTEVARVLVKRGANIESDENEYTNMTPLHEACEHGRQETVQFLIENNANVNATDIVERTPLHLAALNGNPIIIQMLLDGGAKPDVLNRACESPLFCASENGHLEAVKVLFPVTKLQKGKTPLRIACFRNHSEVVEYFFEKDASVELSNERGSSLLAVTCSSKQKTKEERNKIVRLLLKRGAQVKIDKNNLSPLHEACNHNFKSAVALFLMNDVYVNDKLFSETPLLRACIQKAYKIIKMLLEKQADPNIAGRYSTPLEQVLGTPRLTRLLLEHGAKVSTLKYYQLQVLYSDMMEELSLDVLEEKKEDDKFPQLEMFRLVANLQEAFLKDNEERKSNIVDLLIKKDQHDLDFALSLACLKNLPQVAHQLVKLGANVVKSDQQQNDLFAYICYEGYYEIAQLLVARGADAAASMKTYPGYTALQSACAKGHVRIVELLLEKGADVHKVGGMGSTALHEACIQGDPVIIRALLDKGADPLILNRFGESPLYLSAKHGHIEAVKILFDRSNVNLRDKEGNTSCHIASFNGHVEVVEFLISKHDYKKVPNAAGDTVFHRACLNEKVTEENRNAMVLLLLKNGFDLNFRNAHGNIPLHYSCANNFESTSKILIENNSAIDVQATTGERNTPLILASLKKSLATVTLLLSRGANPNIRNAQGTLPLNFADLEMARLLLEKGSETNGFFIYETRLHAACSRNDEEMVQLLLSYNADPLLKNREEISPLHVTQKKGFTHLEKLLLEKISKVTSEEKQ